MTRIPPLLPEETLARVLRVARFDGMGVLTFAGFFAILSALAGDRLGAMIGLLIAAAGAIELHGATLLVHGQRRGVSWLVVSQLYLLLTILGYCQYCLVHPNLGLWHEFLKPAEPQIRAQGETIDHMASTLNTLVFVLVALLTVAYQGGMVVYYVRRRRTVAQALEQESSD